MTSEEQLRAPLHKIEALFARATTAGERVAAEGALTRIKATLAAAQRTAANTQLQFSIADPWARRLFVALARRYALKPYRYQRQRRTTVMLRAPESFLRKALWREFEQLMRRSIVSGGGDRPDHPRGKCMARQVRPRSSTSHGG
jgi:hypothetical protein